MTFREFLQLSEGLWCKKGACASAAMDTPHGAALSNKKRWNDNKLGGGGGVGGGIVPAAGKKMQKEDVGDVGGAFAGGGNQGADPFAQAIIPAREKEKRPNADAIFGKIHKKVLPRLQSTKQGFPPSV